MILDKQNAFSESQAFTATAASENVIDLGKGDLGNSPMEVIVNVEADLVRAAGACNVTIALQTDDNAAFSSATNLATATYAKAVVLAGTELFKVKVPVGAERYLRLNYTFDNAPDSGTMSAYLTMGGERQTNLNDLDIE